MCKHLEACHRDSCSHFVSRWALIWWLAQLLALLLPYQVSAINCMAERIQYDGNSNGMKFRLVNVTTVCKVTLSQPGKRLLLLSSISRLRAVH